jgi:hypothetical protein
VSAVGKQPKAKSPHMRNASQLSSFLNKYVNIIQLKLLKAGGDKIS